MRRVSSVTLGPKSRTGSRSTSLLPIILLMGGQSSLSGARHWRCNVLTGCCLDDGLPLG